MFRPVPEVTLQPSGLARNLEWHAKSAGGGSSGVTGVDRNADTASLRALPARLLHARLVDPSRAT